jgi:hypothetical protein
MFSSIVIVFQIIQGLVETAKVATDGERAIRNAIKHQLGQESLLCWNHVVKASERWIRSHAGKSLDVNFYTIAIKKLFKSKTYEEFLVQYEEQKQSWDEAYISYFENNILRCPHCGNCGRAKMLNCGNRA